MNAKRSLFKVMLLVVFLFVPLAAHASYIADFDINPKHSASAYVAYEGSTLVGAGINVDRIYLAATDENLSISEGVLSFNTGSLASYTYINADHSGWIFNGGTGSSISILGKLGTSLTETILLQGNDVGIYVQKIGNKFSVVLSSASFTITNFLGETGVYSGDLNFSMYMLPSTLTGDYLNASNGYFRVTGNNIASGNIPVSHTPIPAAFLLFGSGLFGMVCVRRRKI